MKRNKTLYGVTQHHGENRNSHRENHGNKRPYEVEFTQTSTLTVKVYASSREEAERKAEDKIARDPDLWCNAYDDCDITDVKEL